VSQLWSWLYVRRATSFAAMTDIAKDLRGDWRASLHARAPGNRDRAGLGQAAQMAAGLEDGRRSRPSTFPKTAARFAFRPGRLHAVCSFCHTGTQRLVRNLTSGEIVGQIMLARDRIGAAGPSAEDPRGCPPLSARSPTSC
jgi:23S rRNA (adenine2503-C2)-methyltransferase